MRRLILFMLLLGGVAAQAQMLTPQYYLSKYGINGNNGGGIPFGDQGSIDSLGTKHQFIYYPSDFPALPEGPVSYIYIRSHQCYYTGPSVYYNFKVKIGYTSKQGFKAINSSVMDTFITNLQTIFQAATFTVAEDTLSKFHQWIKIPVQLGNFVFSKSSNFVVELSYGPGVPQKGFDLFQTTGGGNPPRRMSGSKDSIRSTVRAANVADLGFDRLTTGVESATNITSFGLFPNPATNGRFNISFDAKSAVKEVKVSAAALTGQKVWSRSYPGKGSSFFEEVDLSSLPKGVYALRVEADGEVITRRIIIQ